MNIDAYLERIHYTGPVAPDVATLHVLHRAHLLAVPFENLDIHLGRAIWLDEAALFAKLVTLRRGGFCYEQNGLFAAVLRAMGFDAVRLEARVSRKDGTFGIPFDHMALLVTVAGERWLVDVGFGDSFIEPLRLDDPGEQSDGRGDFRVTHDDAQGVYTRLNNGTWQPQYQFFLQPRALADFASGCDYHQTSPLTSFTQRRVCSRFTPTGRVTLTAGPGDDYTGAKVIRTQGDQREEQALPDAVAWQAALRAYCDVVLG